MSDLMVSRAKPRFVRKSMAVPERVAFPERQLMSSQHRKPILAFVVLVFVMLALLGSQVRATAHDLAPIATVSAR